MYVLLHDVKHNFAGTRQRMAMSSNLKITVHKQSHVTQQITELAVSCLPLSNGGITLLAFYGNFQHYTNKGGNYGHLLTRPVLQ